MVLTPQRQSALGQPRAMVRWTGEIFRRGAMVAFLAVAITLLGTRTSTHAREGAATAGSPTPEQWRRYDRLFFNEAALWHHNSAAYDSRTRPRLFREMAAGGFKVAEIAPQLLTTGPTRNRAAARAAFERLRVLAEKGDTSAMCFLALAWSRSVVEEAFPSYDVILAHVERGAALGHPYCRLVIARLYGSGAEGYPKDFDRAMRIVREVAREGYWEAHVTLFKTYADRVPAYDDRDTLRRTLCWGRLAQQHSNWARFDWYTDKLRVFAVANARRDLLELEKEWDIRSVPIEVKHLTADDCLAMETRN